MAPAGTTASWKTTWCLKDVDYVWVRMCVRMWGREDMHERNHNCMCRLLIDENEGWMMDMIFNWEGCCQKFCSYVLLMMACEVDERLFLVGVVSIDVILGRRIHRYMTVP
jgi:hypothetical protein